MRRTVRALATIVAAAAPVIGFAVPTALSTPAAATEQVVSGVRLNGYEAELVARINVVRHSYGLRSLTVTAGTTDVARRWSWHLAGAQALSHNPALVTDLEHAGSSAWTEISENVGMAPASDPDALFNAYMHSAPHRANILDSQARFLGVGVVQRGDTAWNTLDFTNAYSTTYGRTRVPPQGLTMDQQTITTTTDVASLERPDQRFGTMRAGSVSASLVRFTGPTARNDAATARLVRHGRTGHADLLMRAPLDLRNARSIQIQLAAHDPLGRRIAVSVSLGRSFASGVYLGTVRAGARQWFTLPLPAGARTYRDSLVLRVSSRALGAVGGRAGLVLLDVRAAV